MTELQDQIDNQTHQVESKSEFEIIDSTGTATNQPESNHIRFNLKLEDFIAYAKKGQEDHMLAWIRFTVDINQRISGNDDLNHLFGTDVNRDGSTALMIVCRFAGKFKQSQQMIEACLDRGADPNLQNKTGWTALMFASHYSRENSMEETVRLLLNRGADPNLQEKDGWTALMMASRYSGMTSTEETVRMLLDNGADPNLQNKTGCTALMFAISCTDSTEGTIRMLLEKDINFDLKNKNGLDTLGYAERYIGSVNRDQIIGMIKEKMQSTKAVIEAATDVTVNAATKTIKQLDQISLNIPEHNETIIEILDCKFVVPNGAKIEFETDGTIRITNGSDQLLIKKRLTDQ